MTTAKHRVPIPGSEHPVLDGAIAVGKPQPEQTIEVELHLRRRCAAHEVPDVEVLGSLMPNEREYVSPEEFEAAYGACPEDIHRVMEFAGKAGLHLGAVCPRKRTVKLSGTVTAINAAFGVKLEHFRVEDRTHLGHLGPAHVPAALEEIVLAVLGLDDVELAAPSHRAAAHDPALIKALARAFTVPEIAELYQFPKGLRGRGQCIGIIELGGGFVAEDLQRYFDEMDLPMPEVASVSVDGRENKPGIDAEADKETALDIEVVGSIVPEAKIVVYFAPNTQKGFVDAFKTMIFDVAHNPSVISLSWGGPEELWTERTRTAMQDAFHDAALRGISICVDSGDLGAYDGRKNLTINFPPDIPTALACGGTRLTAANGKIMEEVVWDELKSKGQGSGGGVSRFFRRPGYQEAAGVPPALGGFVGRGMPDVAGNADPRTGYLIRARGEWIVMGGTSAVAPLWAALITQINEALNARSGFINPLLYTLATRNEGMLHSIKRGGNGHYDARAGWDACTGLGSPNGTKILRALQGDR